MIRGYPLRPSVAPGQALTLCVSTDAPRFRVAFHRWGDGFEPVDMTGWHDGVQAPDGLPQADWRWPEYRVDIPAHWRSGVYVAHLLQEHDPEPLGVAMESAAALFVVRGPGRSPVLYRLPIATYQAYNCTGGGCFYFQPPRSIEPPGARLTWRRPGGGIGGFTFGAVDHYDTTSPRQTFAHWDARFIQWLARQGWDDDIEFCADVDFHDDPALLQRHRLLLSVGHDEYWTTAMRDQVERHVAQGGHAAFFGANVSWWRIHLVDDGSAMVCHQGGPTGAFDHWWSPPGALRPEDRMTGVSYRHGGGWWDGPRQSPGYVVQQPDHWAFAGTGLGLGDRFGHASWPPLVGYECDGAPLDLVDPGRGLVALSANAAECGTPASFQPLAAAVLGPDWQELPYREHHGDRQGVHAAVLGVHETGGTVFTAGTTDWAQVLGNGSDAAVPLITRNVIARLAGLA